MQQENRDRKRAAAEEFSWSGPVLDGLNTLVTALAADRPSPGGGAAALVAASLASAILAKALRVSARHAGEEPSMAEAGETGKTAQSQATDLGVSAEASERDARMLLAWAPVDGEMFDTFMAALRLRHETPEEREVRRRALDEAAHRACEFGLTVADVLRTCVRRADLLEEEVTASIRPDVRGARVLLLAALETTLDNAAQNARSTEDRMRVRRVQSEARQSVGRSGSRKTEP